VRRLTVFRQFTSEERRVYGPIDRGDGQAVHLDPLAVLRDLNLALDGDLAGAVRAYNGTEADSGPAERLLAEGRLAEASRKALGLVPFDPFSGHGVTDAQALADLHDFLAWLEKND